MGVFLNFQIAPGRIEPAAWTAAFEEALRIADHCALLDRVPAVRNGTRYIRAGRTAERELSSGESGLLVCGTMDSGWDMEDFCLFRDLEHYSARTREESRGDVLFWGLKEELGLPLPSGLVHVWEAKTQGRPGHIPLLAIACLFAHRFPEAVWLGGDIYAGQCRAAVRLANECLDRPIETPAFCRADALLERLGRTGAPPEKRLEAFFHLYRDALSPDLARTLQKSLPKGVFFRYFRDLLAKDDWERPGYSTALRDCFLLGISLRNLIDMVVKDPEGKRLPLEVFLRRLFACKIHIPFEEKECLDPLGELDAAVSGGREVPHPIDSMLGRFFFTMTAGRNHTLPAYIPLEDIREKCRRAFPDQSTDALIDRLLAETVQDERQEAAYGTRPDSLLGHMRRQTEEHFCALDQQARWDIRDMDEFRHCRPGHTILPALEEKLRESMRQIMAFELGDDWWEFLALDRPGREDWLLRRNREHLLREEIWNYLFDHVMEEEIMLPYRNLFLVDCSSQKNASLVNGLLNCPGLVRRLCEQLKSETGAEKGDRA